MTDSSVMSGFVEITSSKRVKRADYVAKGIPFYRSKEVIERAKGNRITTELFISDEQYTEIEKKFGTPQFGDILLTSVGTLGVSWQVEDDESFYFKDGNLTWFRNFSQRLDPTFLLYWLRSRTGQQELDRISIGSTQRALTIAGLKSLPFSPPKLSDQKAIAHILGTLDDKIELNQKMNQTLEDIAKAIFKSWFVDFDPVRAKAEGRPTGLPPEISDLFPDELVDSEIGEIPKGWEVRPLGSVFLIQYGKNLPTKNLIEDGYPVFGGNGVIGFHSKYIYEEVMTLIACRGAASGKVGRSLPKSFVTNNTLVINHGGAELTSQRFIEFTLESGDPENYVTGSAQPQLTIDNIKNFPFITPPSEIVNSFQGIVNPLANRQLLLDSENQVLSELRDTLLPKLISGELRIPDAEKFLEEAGI